jgi:mRNA-degrading endonuclease toxin of MazEF toxin-antitoxin module
MKNTRPRNDITPYLEKQMGTICTCRWCPSVSSPYSNKQDIINGMSEKQFDTWNEQKKRIHYTDQHLFYHKREVWWCSLGVNVGFEQDGTGADFERPVLILRGFSAHVCLVLPLTTSSKKNPYHLPVGIVDNKKAFVIFSQLRLIDTRRLINKIGVIDEKSFENIRKAVRDML